MQHHVTARRSQSEFALRFFFVSLALVVVASGITQALIHWVGPRQAGASLVVPPTFWITTVLLITGGASLQIGLNKVRLEKQRPFRQALLAALASGTAFVGIQSYGLWCLMQQQNPSEAAIAAGAFVLVFAALHALHFSVAMLFLVFVTVNGFAERYDHEYYWGVTVCTYFWHALSVVWFCILCVIAIA